MTKSSECIVVGLGSAFHGMYVRHNIVADVTKEKSTALSKS